MLTDNYKKIAIIDLGQSNKFEHTYPTNPTKKTFEIDISLINFEPKQVYIHNMIRLKYGSEYCNDLDFLTEFGMCELNKEYKANKTMSNDRATYSFKKIGDRIVLSSDIFTNSYNCTFEYRIPKIIAIE